MEDGRCIWARLGAPSSRSAGVAVPRLVLVLVMVAFSGCQHGQHGRVDAPASAEPEPELPDADAVPDDWNLYRHPDGRLEYYWREPLVVPDTEVLI